MLGSKAREFGPLPPVTLDDLVPPGHVYRHLERALALGFVRDLVKDTSAGIGRPSIDPGVFFKLQPMLVCEGLRSERQVMRVVADRLSLRCQRPSQGTPRGTPAERPRNAASPIMGSVVVRPTNDGPIVRTETGERTPMASPALVSYHRRRAATPAPPPPASLPAWRAQIDAAMGPLPLADGTTAVAVSANGVAAFLQQRDGGDDDPLLVYFHGGGYRLASALAYRAYCSHLAHRAGVRVLNVDYRLAPESPFPAAVADAVATSRWALAGSTPPARVVLAGDSAGGGLAIAALLTLRDLGGAPPAGGVCLSPWVDLTNAASTYASRAATDTFFSLTSAQDAAAHYLQGEDPTHPLASPAFADLAGLPPLLILAGDGEVLLDDARALAETAGAAGVAAELFVYPEMPHVWMLNYPAYPEAAMAFDQIAAFVARVTR